MSFSIMFHYFHDDIKYKKAQGSLNSFELESIINNDKYEILSSDVWLKRYQEECLEQNQVCLSFDDGLKEQFDVALPILDKHRIKAIWNINTFPTEGNIDRLEAYRYFRNYYFDSIDEFYNSFFEKVQKLGHLDYESICNKINFNEFLVDSTFYSYNDRKFRYFRDVILNNIYNDVMDSMINEKVEFRSLSNLWMNKEEIKHLAEHGHKIGLHTHFHSTNLDKLSYEEQYKDFKLNKNILEDIIQNQINIAAYPCGKYNNESIRVLVDLNIDYAFLAHMKQKNNSIYEINRVDCADILKEI